MTSLLSLPHLPILACLSVALILGVLGGQAPRRLCTGLAAVGWLLIVLLVGFMRPQLPIDVVFSDWLVQLTLLGSLIYRVDELNWAFAQLLSLLLFILALFAKLGHEDGEDAHELSAGFLGASGVFSVLFAGNLLTLLCSWAVLMAGSLAALIAGGEERRFARRFLVLFGLAGAFLLWATWLAGRGDGGRWYSFVPTASAVRAILLAAWIALAAYPFHVWLPLEGRSTVDRLVRFWLLPFFSGGYLIVRLSTATDGAVPFPGLWLALGAMGLFMGAQLAWIVRDRRASVLYMASGLAGCVILAAVFPATRALPFILPWVLSLPVAVTVLLLVPPQAHDAGISLVPRILPQVATTLAAASILGLLLMAGWLAWEQSTQIVHLLGSLSAFIVLLALVAVSATLLAASLLRICCASPPEQPTRWSWLKGGFALVVLLPTLGLTIVPHTFMACLAGSSWLKALDYTGSASTPAARLLVLFPAAVGVPLHFWYERAVDRPGWALAKLGQVWSLGWVCTAVESVGGRMAQFTETMADLLNGDHHLLWAFLAMLIFLWFYLSP